MKIVLVLHFPLDRNAGAAGVLFALADQFRSAGHQVATISHDGLMWLPLIIRNLVFPFYVAAKLLLAHGGADVIEGGTGDCWIYYLLRSRRKDTLHITFSQGLYRPLHDRLMRDRASGSAKVSWRYWLFHGSLELWQEALSMRVADCVYVLNAEERRYVVETLRVPSHRVAIVKNGLGEHFQRRAVSFPLSKPPADRVGIVQVGSYEDRKGIKTSVAATTRLLAARPTLAMAYLGTTCSAETTLADYPAQVSDRVFVVPRFHNAQLPEMLAPYQIFIMPSIYEGFGIAPLEAMACGLVPIVTAIAGPAEYIVHGKNGLVVPVDAPEALERAIARLIDDTALYTALQAGALATVASFSWQEVAQARLRDYADFGDRKKTSPARHGFAANLVGR